MRLSERWGYLNVNNSINFGPNGSIRAEILAADFFSDPSQIDDSNMSSFEGAN